MYLIGETEVNVETILKTFKVAEGFVKSLDESLQRVMSFVFGPRLNDDSYRFLRNWGSKFGPIWLPQVFHGR